MAAQHRGDLRWPARIDRGARDVIPALAELGISRLDLAVLTHPHPDHMFGLAVLHAAFPEANAEARTLLKDPDERLAAVAEFARRAN